MSGQDDGSDRQHWEQLASEVRRLNNGFEHLAGEVEALHQGTGPGRAEQPTPPARGGSSRSQTSDDEEFEPFYPSVDVWVEQHFAPMYARSVGNSTAKWCPRWWDHAEAVSRLDALWRAWETLRLDPFMGMAVWYRDHLDNQLNQLLNPAGTFAQCTVDKHAPLKALRTEPAPAGTFTPGGG